MLYTFYFIIINNDLLKIRNMIIEIIVIILHRNHSINNIIKLAFFIHKLIILVKWVHGLKISM